MRANRHLHVLVLSVMVLGLCVSPTKSIAAEGESSVATTTTEWENEEQGSNLAEVDFFPVLVGGIGASLHRRFGDFSVGPMGSYMRMNNFSALNNDVRFNIFTYGLGARWKFSGFEESGFYIGAGVVQSEAKGEGNIGGLLADGKVHVESNRFRKTGWRSEFGYLFLGRKLSAGQFFVNLALNYGTGNSVKYRSSTTSSGSLFTRGTTESGEITIDDMPESLGLIGALGFAF